jgi:TonB family protein
LLLATLAALQAAAPAPRIVQNARPVAGSISSTDYPRSEGRRGVGGVTGARLLVSERGRVTACSITESSRSAALDAAVCRIVQRRFRFQPARDAAGQRGSQWLVTRWTWRAPNNINLGNPSFSPER